MTAVILALLVGLVGGMAVCLQGPLASLMSQRIGALEAAFVIHLGGTVVAGALLVAMAGGGLGNWRSVPWYALWAGVLGLVLITGITFTIPRIGVTATSAAIICGQLLLGSALDHFGVFEMHVRPFDPTRALGLVVLGFGVWLIAR